MIENSVFTICYFLNNNVAFQNYYFFFNVATLIIIYSSYNYMLYTCKK